MKNKIPNQRTIIVKRTTDKLRKDQFRISNNNLRLAMYNLKANEFKLYCYLCDNADKWEFDLYPVDFTRIANVSIDTYYSAFNKLVEKGYLRPHKYSKTLFQFVEESELAKPVPSFKPDMIKQVDEEEFETLKEQEFS